MKSARKILIKNPEGKKTLGKPRRRWITNIKMTLKDGERGYDLDLCGLGLDPVAAYCNHSNKSAGTIKGSEF
jgi:hypothetical protein